MMARTTPRVDIDSAHSAAICAEVGHRLELYFRKEITDTPKELERLLARLKELDRDEAPSLAPR